MYGALYVVPVFCQGPSASGHAEVIVQDTNPMLGDTRISITECLTSRYYVPLRARGKPVNENGGALAPAIGPQAIAT